MALVFRLSALPPPLPRPYHRRIARTIMEDAAAHLGGESFDLHSGDLVLLCRLPTHEAAIDPQFHPAALVHAFERLLQRDVPHAATLLETWDIERDGMQVLGYATQQAAQQAALPC